MEKQKFARMTTVCFILLLCMSNILPVKAQIEGPGVDPAAVMLDDFESGSTARWTPRPGTRGEKVTFELMNAADGDMVRFGNYALKVNIDFTDAQPDQTLTAQISPGTTFDDLQIPGNDAGGKRLGMWVYATPEVEGMWFRIATRAIGASSGTTPSDLSASIDWTGWKYVQCDLPAGHEFHPDGIRFLTLKGYANYYVNGYVIVDNIRVTNQSFNEDLTPPVITGLTGNEINLNNGVFTTSQIDLQASFNDPGTPSSGINYGSIRMIVDGYAFKAGDAGFTVDEETNRVSLTGMNLSNGTHSAIAHVEDNFGHITTVTGNFTINASDGKTTSVTVEAVDQIHVGNPFEMKINTDNSKDIKELEMVLELNNIGSVDASNGVIFAASAQENSSYEFNSRNGYLTINLKNDITADLLETLATIYINISENSNPTDILRCSPVSARAVYSDDSFSLFTPFEAFTREVLATYDFIVNKRIVGAPGEVLVTDLEGNPQAGATVYALNEAMTEIVASAVTNAEGIASEMNFTDISQGVNIYVEKEGKYSYTRLIRTLLPLLTNTPTYIRAGITPDPTTSKTITWMTNPVQSAEQALMKLAKKSEGEDNFQEISGVTKILEYNAVASNGVTKGSSVTVENLEPGVTYIYQIGDGVTWSPTREFTTATATNRFSFSAFGDLQATSNAGMNRFLAAAETIEEMPVTPLFNLNVGDIVDNDDRYDYYSYYGYLFNERPDFANIDMVSGYGNHEYMGNPDADNVKFTNGHHTVEPSVNYNAELVGTGSYAVEYGNMLVISIDWEHRGMAPATTILNEQAKWLEEILSKTDKVWKIVTMHYPIYPNEFTPGASAILGPVFDKHNVQIMFCGHGHTFERVQVYEGKYLVPTNDKRYFEPVIGGTLYFQLGDMTGTGNNGRWVHCEVNGKKMLVTVRNANNDIVENECFTLYASELTEYYEVTFDSVNENGTLTATVDEQEISNGDEILEGKDIIFTATPNSNYRIKEWRVNNTVVNGTENTYVLKSLSEASEVTVEFVTDVPLITHAVNFNTINGNGTLTATVDGVEIASGEEVLEGKDIIFIATPDADYNIKEWKLNDVIVNGIATTYSLNNLAEEVTVTVEFEHKETGVENTLAANLTIYPNPFIGKVYIKGAENSTVWIMDVTGTTVNILKISDEDEVLNLEDLCPGVYLFHIKKEKQEKIVKVMKR